jgi:hypothetical protein
MLIGPETPQALAQAIITEIKRHKGRPFAAFRGDFRKPVKRRAKPGQADGRRLAAAPIILDRSSSVKRLMRAQRIFFRVQKAQQEIST